MIIGPTPLCIKCMRFHEDNGDHFTCDAFPEGIPDEIVLGGFNHNRPFPGDHGMQFVARVKFAVVDHGQGSFSPFAQEVFGRLIMGSTDERFAARMRTLVADIERAVSGLAPKEKKTAWKAFYRIIDELLTKRTRT